MVEHRDADEGFQRGYRLHHVNDNVSAELWALNYAADIVAGDVNKYRHCHIVGDCVPAWNKVVSGQGLGAVIASKLQGAHPHCWWVPSHSGCLGNEVADGAACEGTEHGECKEAQGYKGWREWKSDMMEGARKEWQRRWDNNTGSLRRYMPAISKWRTKLMATRSAELQLARLRLGRHRFKAGELRCTCGEWEPTIDHFFRNCPAWVEERKVLTAKLEAEVWDSDRLESVLRGTDGASTKTAWQQAEAVWEYVRTTVGSL